jgi:hypothetical protein
MTISTGAARQAVALALPTPMSGRLKPRHDHSDFGGEDSHLLKVRLIGRDYPCGDDVRDGDFGFYLGRPKEDRETRRHGERSGQKNGWQKNGRILSARGKHLSAINVSASLSATALVQPLQGWRLARAR